MDFKECAGIHERAEESAQGSRQEIIPFVIEDFHEETCRDLFVRVVWIRLCFRERNRATAQAKKPPAVEAPMPQIDKEKIRAHVKYLSSDEFEGRGTGQRGGDMAADYIGKQFASYGFEAGGGQRDLFSGSADGGREDAAGNHFSNSRKRAGSRSRRKILPSL